ncbi:MAG: hypothetical protein U1E78_12805, partial [Gammaproteobacteria bacterium]
MHSSRLAERLAIFLEENDVTIPITAEFSGLLPSRFSSQSCTLCTLLRLERSAPTRKIICEGYNSLWSISRGLARAHRQYKALLMEADQPRQGDYDGRGALTQRGLNEFCIFFIKCCLEQV